MLLESRLFAIVPMVLGLVLGSAPGSVRADDRSTEFFRYLCSNELGRRDITLFANGTVRLRQGRWETQELYLDELLPEELSDYVAQLRDIQKAASRPQTDLLRSAPQGDWVEQCEIHLALPESEPLQWHFSTLEVPPLVVSHLVQLAEDLSSYTKAPASVDRVPGDYEPRRGDVMVAVDGGRFRVIGLTTDGRAVEFEGLDAPLRLFVPIDELGRSFQTLEKRGGR